MGGYEDADGEDMAIAVEERRGAQIKKEGRERKESDGLLVYDTRGYVRTVFENLHHRNAERGAEAEAV